MQREHARLLHADAVRVDSVVANVRRIDHAGV